MNDSKQFKTSTSFSLAPKDLSKQVCEHCSYRRQSEDNAPSWACPSCGISYGVTDMATDDKGQFFAARIKPSVGLRNQTSYESRKKRAKRRHKTRRLAIAKKFTIALALVFSVSTALLFIEPDSAHEDNKTQPNMTKSKKLHIIDDQDRIVKN